MDTRELFLAQHARSHAAGVAGGDPSNQDLVLSGMTEEQIRQRPHPSTNSLAWLLWRMTRAEDIGINLVIAERPQALDEDRWSERLGVPHRDLGAGMTDNEVEGFTERIDIPALLAYRAATGQRTQEVIAGLRPEVLAEVIDADLVRRVRVQGAFGPDAEWVPRRWEGKPKAFTLMHTVLAHSYLHIGEGHVVRSLLGLPNL